MEHAKDRLEAEIALLEQALGTLQEALREPVTDLVRDATIQRFEYTFELSWKTIQVAAKYMVASPCRSPREAIKTAFKMGWIQNPEAWFEAMDARNMTVHTYNEKLAMVVYNDAKKFPELVHLLLGELKQI